MTTKMKTFHRKKKDINEKRELISEPSRRSIYDVLQTNLKLAKRVTYIHRILYIGEHNYEQTQVDEQTQINIPTAMEQNYKLTNTGYCTEPLSGILLHYRQYFCYIVEGSEEALHKHLTLLYEHNTGNLSNVRILSAVHHVKGRFWDEWLQYCGRPSERVEEIDPDQNLENSMIYATECCEKMYRFAYAFITQQLALRDKGKETDEGELEVAPSVLRRSRSLVERDIYSPYLPERALLKFLTKCKYLQPLEQYHRYYEYVGQARDFSQKAWPAPKNFVPYNIFDPKYDPITNLPPVQGQEVKVEEGEEDVVEELTKVESVHTTQDK